jgi:hypothetical protein
LDFHSDEEFGGILKTLCSMSAEERKLLRKTVRESVKDRSSVSIAHYLLDLYQTAVNRRNSGLRIGIHEAADQ